MQAYRLRRKLGTNKITSVDMSKHQCQQLVVTSLAVFDEYDNLKNLKDIKSAMILVQNAIVNSLLVNLI